MSFYSFKENSVSSFGEEENDLSDLNLYNCSHSQSSTNKYDLYKTDSNSYELNTIDDLIKKEFMNEKMSDISEDDSLNMERYQFKIEKKSSEQKEIEESSHKKIFKISKIPKNEQISQASLGIKRNRDDVNVQKKKKNLIDWEHISVPKEKHFHFDRKKHRIVFQRKHLKVIYSIVDLVSPFDFNKYFQMIKEHIGDKTNQNYGKGKSFHIIKVGNEEKIVTLKEKKNIMKNLKNNKHSYYKKKSNNKDKNSLE